MSPMALRERPMSPHLQIYRRQLTSVMSILHRISGLLLTVGVIGLAWWLLAVDAGGERYAQAARIVASPLGLLVLFGFSLSLVYHLLNGLRHLLWDMGWGFEIDETYRSGWAVAALTIVFTAAIWFATFGARA
jgi:succinate dehydrogenase / fumarate reductase, cytochrome b subunit